MSDPIVISLIVLVFILLSCWAISGASANEWKEKYTTSVAEWKDKYAKLEKNLFEAKGPPTVRSLKNTELYAREQKLFEAEKKLETQKQAFDQDIRKIIDDKSQQYPYIATQIADLYLLYDEQLAKNLAQKAHPAVRASEDVARIAGEKRELMQRVKALEYQIAEYEAISPQLSSIADLTTSELCEASQSSEDRDSLRDWLSDSEYVSLSDERKFQLALDRWRRRPRSNWQVGRDFERYIGYLYEMNGWKVSFFGALNGKNDLCRDLIAQKNSQTLIIQCKRWAKEKTIHEKHVFQLFGSVMSYGIENPGSSPKGLLITTCPLSDVAKQYAHALNIFRGSY